MNTPYSPHDRAERLIAAGRVALASSSLLAVWLDPSEPAKHASVAYALLALYVVYAMVMAALVWRSDNPAGRQRVITHAFDFVYFSLFVYFTAGPGSPFTAYFVFSMVCATLRWQWRGALWTATASLLTFLGLGVYFAEVLRDPAFQLTPFIIRSVYLGVMAVLLGYLGIHEQRVRREMATLAGWPNAAGGSLEENLRHLLVLSAKTLEAPRLVLAWQEPEEPWLYLAALEGEHFELAREPPAASEPPVSAALEGASFLCPDVGSTAPSVLVRVAAGLRGVRGEPIHSRLRDRFEMRSVLSVVLRGDSLEGRLFVLDKRGMTSDDLVLGEVVAEMMRARLDLFSLTLRLQEAAATEERIRLARDLHDGVLQSLTGISLRLEALRRRVAAGPAVDAAVEPELAGLLRLVALEQRDLRFFIRELQPPASNDGSESLDLGARLSDLAERLDLEWGLVVELSTAGLDRPLPDLLAREIYHMVREALINAARHGRASRVSLEIEAREGRSLRLRVDDNGCGFPFVGHFSGNQLAARNLGPRSLRERVSSLSGSLELESSERGACLEIRLPAPEAA